MTPKKSSETPKNKTRATAKKTLHKQTKTSTMEVTGLEAILEKSEYKNKEEAKYIINLPDHISVKKPLNVFRCNDEIHRYCQEKLGNAELIAWAEIGQASNISIRLKYIKNQNFDVPSIKICRDKLVKSNGCMNFLFHYAGIDNTIVRFVYDVMKEALALFDSTKDKEISDMSIVETYKSVLKYVSTFVEKSETGEEKVYKEVDEFACIKGTKAMKKILSEVGSPFSRLEFLSNLKSMVEYGGKEREFLKISEGRAYDYCETGGEHWVYIKKYKDIIEEE